MEDQQPMQMVLFRYFELYLKQQTTHRLGGEQGTRTFRLDSSSVNTLTGDLFTSAEVDYVAKGLMNTVQGTVVSTREAAVNEKIYHKHKR